MPGDIRVRTVLKCVQGQNTFSIHCIGEEVITIEKLNPARSNCLSY